LPRSHAETHMTRPVLVVDDNPTEIELTLLAFKHANLVNPIQIAHDGVEALAWIPRWEAGEPKPVVVLLDINMPKLDGLAVLRALKSHPVSRSIPVVMLTTSSMSKDLESSYASGANSFIVKPVNFDRWMDVAKQIQYYWTVLNQVPE
jgi:CheY-like chemotaxis protein